MCARFEEIAGATGDIEGTGALIIHQAEELRGNIKEIFRDSEKYLGIQKRYLGIQQKILRTY